MYNTHILYTLCIISYNNYLDSTRTIKNAVCQCPAGAGSKCKHIDALIKYIDSEEGTSTTDEPQQWGRSAKYYESLYKKVKKISDLFPQKQFSNDIPIPK